MTDSPDSIRLETAGSPLGALFQRALKSLRDNVKTIQGFDVLIEGAEYNGIWLECGPHEAALYARLNPSQIQVALDSHRAFFHHQREDGYLPCNLRPHKIGSGQIQSVVPIAETAWWVYEQCGDVEFLQSAYDSCARWDDWLGRYRDTRETGLCEAFCEFDTGHDNSPRFHGLPKQCPNEDARVCPDVSRAPFIAPDLSATRFGGQSALARMARALGRDREAQSWQKRAEKSRLQLIATCYDASKYCFFDVDNNGEFVRVCGDALTRVLGEGLVAADLFETIYENQIRNPEAFWTSYPLPSIAINDPQFVHDLPHNSWGGASQALTAMRTPRWMLRAGKFADLTHLMEQWVGAILAHGAFSQQMNPWTGVFNPDGGDYSPSMLVLLDFATRLYGVRREDSCFKWGCALPVGATECHYVADFPEGKAVLHQSLQGAELTLAGNFLARVQGRCQIVTNAQGQLQKFIGTTAETAEVTIHFPNGIQHHFHCHPDAQINF